MLRMRSVHTLRRELAGGLAPIASALQRRCKGSVLLGRPPLFELFGLPEMLDHGDSFSLVHDRYHHSPTEPDLPMGVVSMGVARTVPRGTGQPGEAP